MKSLFTLALLFYFSLSHSQNNEKQIHKDSLIAVEQTCESGMKSAKSDFSKGIYNSYSYGLVARSTAKSEIGFNDFFVEYMFKKYQINIANKGCVIDNYSSCYSDTMHELIYKKFGSDIFDKGRKEAKQQFVNK